MHDINLDTICAPATTPGTGAISIIRISGPQALEITDKVVSFNSGSAVAAKGYTIKFGTVYGEGQAALDEVLVSIFKAPRSYTGENSVEISCHASSYIVQEMILLLIKAGARAAHAGEFTQRAYLNGKMDLAQAEAVADVIAAQSSASHRVALNQLKGGFSGELKQMRAELLTMVSLMELELDFSEEEVEFADRGQLDVVLDAVLAHVTRLKDSFRLGNAIKNGIPVAIAGTTNTGKSTLLNALLGEERAIVSDIDGTTRDTVEETLNIDGVLFRFIDTAGIRKTDEVVEKIGIERSFAKITQAEVVLAMVDLTRDLAVTEDSIKDILKTVQQGQDVVFVLNKIDAADAGAQEAVRRMIAGLVGDIAHKIIPISAKTQEGVGGLKAVLAEAKKSIITSSDATLVTNIRHFEALALAQESLIRVRDGLNSMLPTDLVAQDIREAIYDLGSIVGEISTDEVLGNIFRNFCIGK